MTREQLPNHFNLDGQNVTFGEIHRQFAQTQYGDILRNNVRFGSFKPDGVSNSEWRKLLGADVNNLDHMPLSLGLTKDFLRHCANPPAEWQGKVTKEAEFTSSEQSLLLLTAIVHDQAEAVIGDIPLPKKTKSDEEREMIVFKKIFGEVLGHGKDTKAYAVAADQVVDVLSNTESKLGRAFNAIEHVGYTRTALRAWDRSHTSEGDIKATLEQMADAVIPHGLPRLVAYSEIYPPVDLFLMHHKKSIDQILEGKMPYVVAEKVVWEADSKLG
jgi:hypothetical protein